MAISDQYGISIHVDDTIIGTSSPAGARYFQERDWAEVSNSYSHTIGVDIGFDKMSISFGGSLSDIEDWLEAGLALHVMVYNKELSVVWEGFVNSMSANLGSLSIARGPVVDVINRTKVDYKTIRFDTVPPIGGDPAATDLANDTDSQALYGILVGYVSGGEGDMTVMEDLRDTFLAENKLPRTDQDITIGSGQPPSITVDCLGYYHLLKKYYYQQIVTAAEINASQKITDVVDADPNSVLSTSGGNIDTNTVQVTDYEDGTKKGEGIIKDLLSLGDTSGNRYIFGIYEDREAYFQQAPTAVFYNHRISDNPTGLLLEETDQFIDPWDIRPGNWVFMPDFMVGRSVDTNLRDDPRALFIESVSFSTPYSTKITGSKLYTFSHKVARLGLDAR